MSLGFPGIGGSGSGPATSLAASDLANPSATIGLTAVNGSATTALRSDGAPALSQAIIPTWTGLHTFNAGANFPTSTSSSVGVLKKNNVAWMSDYAGSGAGGNAFLAGAGNFTLTTAASNLGIGGLGTLSALTTGVNNTVVGNFSGTHITTGTWNTNLGYGNLLALINGNYNQILGSNAFIALTSGSENVSVGDSSAQGITTGSDNIAIGDSCFPFLASPGNESLNISVGANGLTNLTAGSGNLTIGTQGIYNLVTGSNNVNMGLGGFYTNGSNNTGIGYKNMWNVPGDLTGCVAIGAFAGNNATTNNEFFLNNQDRTNYAGDQTKSLLYGVFNATAASQTLTVNAAWNQTYKTAIYNNVATAGWGTPAIYAANRVTARTSAAASIATYTVGAADGSFIVSANVNVTAATTASFTCTCTYTDETNTSRTQTLSFFNLAGVPLQTITNVTGTGTYTGAPAHIRCKASTAITFATVGTFTSVTYNAEGVIQQIA